MEVGAYGPAEVIKVTSVGLFRVRGRVCRVLDRSGARFGGIVTVRL
jgi:hypothetical protein